MYASCTKRRVRLPVIDKITEVTEKGTHQSLNSLIKL